jgi:hypothetical protein
MSTLLVLIGKILLLAIIKVVCLLVAIAYYTLAERKIMAAVQRRVGPNVVGFIGLLQPLADGLKLAAKELIMPMLTFLAVFPVLHPVMLNTYLDPLEQFDVLNISLPLVGGLTNLSLLLGLNILLMLAWFSSYSARVTSTYDFVLRALYQLVRSMLKENLYIKKQQYFTALFYLFFTLLLANLVGMIPYSFTITSSFIVTFFLAMTYFVAINHILTVKHQ